MLRLALSSTFLILSPFPHPPALLLLFYLGRGWGDPLCKHCVLPQDDEQTYVTRKYASVHLTGKRLKRMFHSDTTRLSFFQPDFASFVRQQCSGGRFTDILLVDQVGSLIWFCESLCACMCVRETDRHAGRQASKQIICRYMWFFGRMPVLALIHLFVVLAILSPLSTSSTVERLF